MNYRLFPRGSETLHPTAHLGTEKTTSGRAACVPQRRAAQPPRHTSDGALRERPISLEAQSPLKFVCSSPAGAATPLVEISGRRYRAARMLSQARVVPRWLLLAVLLSPGVHAQTDQERAGARSAAMDGIRALEEGRPREALGLLHKAEALVPSPVHLLYVARAHAALGELVSAREAYMKVLVENLAPNAPKAFHAAQESARKELPEIDARLPKLTLNVEGYAGDDLVVTVDGTAWSTALLGVATPADPGERRVVASAPGWSRVEQTVLLQEGQAEVLTLRLEPGAVGVETNDAGDGGRSSDEATSFEFCVHDVRALID